MKKKILPIITCLFLCAVLFVVIYAKTHYVLPILMYHNINGLEEQTKLSVSPANFDRQMGFLKKHNYNVISLTEAIDLVQNNKPLPGKTVCITFDDGFEDNFLNAYPILKKYNLPATIFVISGEIGKKDYLKPEQIKEMADSGIISIGAHTQNHSFLPNLSKEQAYQQIRKSKKVLESITQKPVKLFSYPGGGFTKDVRELVKNLGFKGACATNPGRCYPDNDAYALKRVRISRTSENLLVFAIESSGFYTMIKEIRDED